MQAERQRTRFRRALAIGFLATGIFASVIMLKQVAGGAGVFAEGGGIADAAAFLVMMAAAFVSVWSWGECSKGRRGYREALAAAERHGQNCKQERR